MYLWRGTDNGKVNTEEVRRKRGRPKLDAHITEEYAPSRRQALNKMYLYEGVHLLSVAATEIQNSEVLWLEDRKAVTVKSRDGILEQLGRMAVQDKLAYADGVYLANLAIAAVQNGHTTREVETALRQIRMAAKSSMRNPDNGAILSALDNTVDILRKMGSVHEYG